MIHNLKIKKILKDLNNPRATFANIKGTSYIKIGKKTYTLEYYLQSAISESVRSTELAFGNCFDCYGKGYSTHRYGYTESSDLPDSQPIRRTEHGMETHMNFCKCNRGRQLENLVSEKVKRSRLNIQYVIRLFDKAFSTLHGGGNARRLAMQFKSSLEKLKL